MAMLPLLPRARNSSSYLMIMLSITIILSTLMIFFSWNFLPLPVVATAGRSITLVNSSVRDQADFQIISSYSTTIILERPHNIKNVRGIFFIAHACTHSAYDFWPKSESCPECVGLAEEVEIVRSALSQHFLVIAISSLDRKSGCWSLDDVEGVEAILTATKRSVPYGIPLFALGCSSGGRFLWKFSQYLLTVDNPPFLIDGMIIQSMALPITLDTIVPLHPPPIIFSPMIRDEIMYRAVLSNNATLIDELHYPSVLIKFAVCHTIPLSTAFLLSRLYYLNLTSPEVEQIYSLLLTNGYINTEGLFLKDPTDPMNNWREIMTLNLPSSTLSKLVLTLGKSPLAKVFNRCWAYHEYCADHIKENLLWLKFMRHKQLHRK